MKTLATVFLSLLLAQGMFWLGNQSPELFSSDWRTTGWYVVPMLFSLGAFVAGFFLFLEIFNE